MKKITRLVTTTLPPIIAVLVAIFLIAGIVRLFQWENEHPNGGPRRGGPAGCDCTSCQRALSGGFAIGDIVRHKLSGLKGQVIRTWRKSVDVELVIPETAMHPTDLRMRSFQPFEIERID